MDTDAYGVNLYVAKQEKTRSCERVFFIEICISDTWAGNRRVLR